MASESEILGIGFDGDYINFNNPYDYESIAGSSELTSGNAFGRSEYGNMPQNKHVEDYFERAPIIYTAPQNAYGYGIKERGQAFADTMPASHLTAVTTEPQYKRRAPYAANESRLSKFEQFNNSDKNLLLNNYLLLFILIIIIAFIIRDYYREMKILSLTKELVENRT